MHTTKLFNFVFKNVHDHSNKHIRCLYSSNQFKISASNQILLQDDLLKRKKLHKVSEVSTSTFKYLRTNVSQNNSEKGFTEPTHNFAFKMVRSCPASIQPYLKLMRIDRPIGTWLVFLPCAWSISLAATPGNLPDVKLMLLFGLGSFFMRGAGCTINDMWDKDFDGKVERTRNRPLASGEVTRFKALCFLSIPLSISLSILLTLNYNTIILGVCSMVPCILYPVAKRFTYWPQFFLGITFNWGILMGWSAYTGALSLPVLPLYISAISWTLFYDTMYAFQDIEDDLKVGLKSTAIRFGKDTKKWLAGFNVVTSASLLSTGLLLHQNWIYYTAVALFSAHLASQVWKVDLTSREDCGQKFRSNRDIGFFLLAALMASSLYNKYLHDHRNNQQQHIPPSQTSP